jgi:iron complex transport system permease protein
VKLDRRALLLAALAVAAPFVLLVALVQGSVATSFGDVLAALGGEPGTAAGEIVLKLRLPRAAAAFAVGGLLALAGSLLQVLLRNPLADPYVLGVSGGASVAALAAILLGAGSALGAGAAFGGALGAMLLVFGLSRVGRDPWTANRLLLTGVVVAAGFGALVSLLLALAPPGAIQGMVFWLLGDLSNATQPAAGWVVLALGLALAMARARSLNVLARGERVAQALGEDAHRLRWLLYFLASLLTASAVTIAGNIGFVGLVVPHALRLAGLADHRFLLPGAVLAGGGFLVVADTLARSVLAPTQLPAGVLTALLGVPIFLILLARGTRT